MELASAGDASRRAFLRGAGVALALPAFEIAAARRAAAAATEEREARSHGDGAPLRMAFVYVPNGVHQGYWWPKKEGNDFELTKTLQPLENVKQHYPDPGRPRPDQRDRGS